MEKVLKKYNIFLKRKGLSVRGEEYYMWHTKKFFEYTGAKIKDFGDKKKFQKKYDKIILRETLCNESKKKHLKCARIFADFLVEEKIIWTNAPRKIQPPKVQTSLPIPIEDSDIVNIFQAIKRRWGWMLAYRNTMIVETLLNTWIRRAEIINLKRCNVHDDHIIIKCGKGRKDRVVYISREFFSKIREYMNCTDGVSEYVFFTQRSNQISIRAMSRIFEVLKAETQIEELFAHKMRHTYASKVLENWISLAVLREQLGHTNIATTNRYLAVTNKHRKSSMENFKVI